MSTVWKARAFFAGTVAAGAAVLAAAPWMAAEVSLGTLALLGAAAVLMELVQVSGDESSTDPADAGPLSFSSAVHIAAILIIGPWVAAAVAAFGVLAVDRLRGAGWRQVLFNASAFALAAVAGGYAFRLGGGTSGAVELPHDFFALGALVVVYYTVNNGLTSAIFAFATGRSAMPVLTEVSRDGLAWAAGEAGLGIALGLFALYEPWAIAALVPLLIAVYRAHERLVTLRCETANALETFANVIDERDPSTHRHSARVAEHVRGLAEALGLPPSTVARLRFAGRLHDLGKIAVDASVLSKPGKLDEDEWESMLRHPRISARLLRRFHLAAREARAVEYHHERFDGHGYYGIRAAEIPLAAHFLIVADSYDAMTSDRPYRRGLPAEIALAEIEGKAGTQFHPVIAKAFVAFRRGLDPVQVLAAHELAEIRRLESARPVRPKLRLGSEVVVAGSLVAALGSYGLGAPLLALPALMLAAGGLLRNRLEHRRRRVLTASLRSAIGNTQPGLAALAAVAEAIGHHRPIHWAGTFAWDVRRGAGSAELVWDPAGQAPGETAVTSWFLREAEWSDRPLVSSGAELGRDYGHVALSLSHGGSSAGYLVVGVSDDVRAVADALAEVGDELAEALAPVPRTRLLEALAS
jgi:HD-GYP domain-containing protein (c-di-GMP phosphodiesterase class II)